MPTQADSGAAYVLHTRPYRETSVLVDFLTLDQGRVSAVARGARRPNSQLRSVLQPFQPLYINLAGRHELKNLRVAEAAGIMPSLTGNSLICGLYVNELLQRLLPIESAYPHLFLYYQYVLNALRENSDVQAALRIFELRLLRELGVAPDLSDVEHNALYRFSGEGQFEKLSVQNPASSTLLFRGEDLHNIYLESFNSSQTLNAAKRLMRLLIAEQLDNRPLNSRALFQKYGS